MSRSAPGWRHAALGVAVLAVGASALFTTRSMDRLALPTPAAAPPAVGAPAPPAAPQYTLVLHVDPDTGDDSADGSERAPLRTIQTGLEKATPGTLISLAPGVYRESVSTVRDGAPGAPITIKGPETGTDRAGRYKATLYGTGRIVSVNHSWYTFDGFTIDGQEELAGTTFPTDIARMTAFKDSVKAKVSDGRLVYVGADESSRDIAGITLNNMFLNGAGGECVRFRNNAHDSTVSDSVIQYCGLFGKGDGKERAVYHNGEGVYIGTSPNSDDQPMHANDGSSRIVVTRNVIRTFGSECFNIKENAHDNVFADNVCEGNTESLDDDGSNIELRGYANVVRNNQISESAGVNLKIKADKKQYDKGGNVVENNRLSGAPVALQVESSAAQGPMCGNVVASGTTLNKDDDDGVPVGGFTTPCKQ